MRVWLLILLLVAASLACTLSPDDDNPDAPTTAPTPISNLSQGTTPTNIPAITTPRPTSTGGVLLPTPQNNCLVRTDWQTMTVASGDTLSSIAQRVNVTVDQLITANCLSNPNALTAGQTLRVPFAPAPATSVTSACPRQWFFTFQAGDIDPGAPCPGVLQPMDAVGQNFEGGRVLWYKTSTVGEPDTLYVIYNDGSWEFYSDTWVAGMPENDPSIVPPADRFQPVRGIGKVWREQPGVRGKLGWAYGPESFFSGRRQFPDPPPGTYSDIYVDHGRDGLVLRLRRTSGMTPTLFWEVVGNY